MLRNMYTIVIALTSGSTGTHEYSHTSLRKVDMERMENLDTCSLLTVQALGRNRLDELYIRATTIPFGFLIQQVV